MPFSRIQFIIFRNYMNNNKNFKTFHYGANQLLPLKRGIFIILRVVSSNIEIETTESNSKRCHKKWKMSRIFLTPSPPRIVSLNSSFVCSKYTPRLLWQWLSLAISPFTLFCAAWQHFHSTITFQQLQQLSSKVLVRTEKITIYWRNIGNLAALLNLYLQSNLI